MGRLGVPADEWAPEAGTYARWARGLDGSGGDGGSDTEAEAEREQARQARRWRSRPPLLPHRMASLVSTVSGATRLSLEITSLFWEAVFDTISESTSSGRWLGTAAWQEAKGVVLAVGGALAPLTSLNPRIVSRIVQSSTAAGYSLVNRSLAATESLVEGGFALSTKAVNMGLHAAGEYVRFIDAVFGATDTSRVLASFFHMVRREAVENNPEIRALIKEHGLVGFASHVVKTLVAWTCLQVVTHGRARPYRMDLVYTNIRAGPPLCPRRFVSSTGEPLAPARPGAGEDAQPAAAASAAGSPALAPVAVVADNDGDSDGGDSIQYALSDQEGAHESHGWSRRLAEALGSLPARKHRDEDRDAESSGSEYESDAPSRQSIWTTLHTAREAAAREHANDAGDCDDGDDDGDGASLSPLADAAANRDSAFPAFGSAPASLVSSPQLPSTPGPGALRYSASIARIGGGGEARASSEPPGIVAVDDDEGDDDDRWDALPPAIAPIVDAPAWPADAGGLRQEFPARPLLFNLARFISVASSAYGRRFMQVIGMDSGMIDARALIDAFGEPEAAAAAAAGPLSQSASGASLDQAADHQLRGGAAQPMSPYHAHTPAQRRPARPVRPETPSARRVPGRRAHPHRRAHLHRRPVPEHPNHFCFSQHTGIPLSDLLFSSYVPPIVPGVTKAASAQASAVERRLRHRRSASAARALAAKLQQHADQAAAEPTPEPTPEPGPGPGAGRWLSALPVVGTVCRGLSGVPGAVSRALGYGSAEPAPAGDEPPCKRKAEGSAGRTPREPTAGQFRRFDKVRRRLVYRNPSIHALVHYIAVDHPTHSVVLACRGTLGISDLFIDMICEYEPVRLPAQHATALGDGAGELRAHAGMWHSALLLADPASEVFREVAEALRLYPEYGLVVTGHSLGGGVASLLTLLWSQPQFGPAAAAGAMPASLAGTARRFVTTDRFGLVAPRPIHCFSYGSPCSTNAALSQYCRGLVTSVVNTDDFVSFLSVGACVDILNISAVLGRERGVAEKVMRGFLAAQRARIAKRFSLFDFDLSRLHGHRSVPDDASSSSSSSSSASDSQSDGAASPPGSGAGWWGYRTTQRRRAKAAGSPGSSAAPSSRASEDGPWDGGANGNGSSSSSSSSSSNNNLDDWHLSLVKTLRASMDSEKLYPPGDVFILASPGDDEEADRLLPLPSSARTSTDRGASNGREPTAAAALPVGLFYCPDVVARFSELRFTRNMIVHHLPSTYERKLSALVHDTYTHAHTASF
ncbi:hypothetical protein H4R18_005377 [Coemansia javaensis]|uniref:sn-1-specific diacylglycerol lipase n=1 Tax=Coemansia javaensis TaxID=2761396 RepID=A0A9W8H8S3_9FUNG|nr:hypothetical protein H4R18_005377 [Coemansia javaensis]